MPYVFAPPPQPVVPVIGTSDLFPIHRVYCVGRNYAEHAREMGFSGREPPFFFAKPADAVIPVPEGSVIGIPYPGETHDFHHEIELVVAIGRRGRTLSPQDAAASVWGYAVGLDMTRRDLQGDAKKNGRPWETGKAFDASAPLSPIRRAPAGAPLAAGRIWLSVNGTLRQEGDLAQLTWNVGETIEHLSRYFELAPGDLIFTGTPAGVAAVVRGDRLDGGIDGVGRIALRID